MSWKSEASATLRHESLIALMLDKQHLSARAVKEDVRRVADDLLGLHATVAPSPYLQLRARIPGFGREQLDALLDAGQAAKLACMRRTLFIESAELVPIVFAATRELRTRGQQRFLAANGLTPVRYERLAERVAAALAGRSLDASQLRDVVSTTEPLSPVIIVMCDQGRLIRWKGATGWQSTRPTYRRFDEVLPNVRLDTWEEQAAVSELVDRYVRRYGPVTERDVAWWTGLRVTTVRDVITSHPSLVNMAVEGLEGDLLAHETDVVEAQRRTPPPADEVSLLPVLDPYLQGYRDRERCIAPRHHRFVVDPGGNVTSVILTAGRVAGIWDFVAKPAPELRLLFFDPPAPRTRRRVRALALDLGEFLTAGAARVVEVDRVTSRTHGNAGWFLSPLDDPT